VTAERYSRPTSSSYYELREKKSRFVATLSLAASEPDARRLLAKTRIDYPDVSHHCWAFRIGIPPVERSSDAGEPAGTGGVPILQVLRGAELTNVMAIVSRWFGGTKLGKGGLARAYAASIREALRELQVEEVIPMAILDLELPLSRVGDLKRVIHPPEVEILEETYSATAQIAVHVALDRVEAIEETLRSRQIFPVRRGEST
jgi:uncharacterized YigZ family protein